MSRKTMLLSVAVCCVLIGAWSFLRSGLNERTIHARLEYLRDTAQRNKDQSSNVYGKGLLPPGDVDELKNLVKRLQPVASSKNRVKQELLWAARDGLLKLADGPAAETEWHLKMCSEHLETAGRLLKGEQISEMKFDPHFPLPPSVGRK